MVAVRRIAWFCCLLASNFAGADEMSAANLASIPESVEINGDVLTASGYPYFNRMPSIASDNAQPIDCQRNGSFIVSISVHVRDSNLHKQLSAGRVWVIQEEKIWSGSVLKADIRRDTDYVRFASRDCNAPLVPARSPIRDQSDLDNAIRAKTIIELKYAGKHYLLRLPDAIVGEVY